MIESPCVKICTLDARSGLCLGCGRYALIIAGPLPDADALAAVGQQ